MRPVARKPAALRFVRATLVVAFALMGAVVAAQTTIAELESRLPALTGRQRVSALNELAALVVEGNPDQAQRLSIEALELAGSLGDRAGEAAARFGLGDAHRVRSDYRSALEEYATARRLFEAQGDTLQIGRSIRRLGDIHYFVSDYERSLRYYLEALEIFTGAAEGQSGAQARRHVGHLLTTVGNVLRKSGDLEEALGYYRRSHAVYEQENFAVGLRGALYNIGNILFEQGRVEEAGAEYEQVLELARTAGDTYQVALALSSLGAVHMGLGDLEGAESRFLAALEIDRQVRRKPGVLANLKRLMELYRLQGSATRGVELADEALTLARELGDRSAEAEVALEQARLFEEMGSFGSAVSSLRRHLELREEILSEKRIRQLDELRLRFETEAKEREIAVLRKDKALQRLMTIAAVAGLLMTVSVLSLVVRSGRLRARVALELEAKNVELSAAYGRVEELSRTDELTALANRRAMMEHLRQEQTRFQRSGKCFSVLLADLDDFKQWNDRFGHGCGDTLLVAVAARLRAAVRQQDVVGRWGGEEFLILLPETGLSGALRVAEKVRMLIGADAFSYIDEQISLTVTVGVSVGGADSVDEVLRLADRALYLGKDRGKNRVETLAGV